MITDADEWHYRLRDGWSELIVQLTATGCLEIAGNEIDDRHCGVDRVFVTTHPGADIDVLSKHLTAMVEGGVDRHVLEAFEGSPELAFQADPSGRVRLTAYDVSTEDRYPIFGASYSHATTTELADFLAAMAAHTRGEL